MNKPSAYGNYSAIILSAGKSSRMGVNKFSLQYDEKTTFLEKIVSVYSVFGCNEIIIVLNTEGAEHFAGLKIRLPSNARIIENQHPEWERFYSLRTGAKALGRISHTFISNIDNPFINKDVLDKLALQIEKYDYVFPMFKGRGGHPFIISEKVIKDIIKDPHEQLNIKDFLNHYSGSGVEVNDDKILLNINTIDDYRKIFPDLMPGIH